MAFECHQIVGAHRGQTPGELRCIVFYAASDRDESYSFATYLSDRFSRHDVVLIESALRIPSNAEAESK